MKLLNCTVCHDIVKLYSDLRSCRCGKSHGRYIDDNKALHDGPSRIISLRNALRKSLKVPPGDDCGSWWIITGDSVLKR